MGRWYGVVGGNKWVYGDGWDSIGQVKCAAAVGRQELTAGDGAATAAGVQMQMLPAGIGFQLDP